MRHTHKRSFTGFIFYAIFLIFSISGCAHSIGLSSVPDGKLYYSADAPRERRAAYRNEVIGRHPDWPEDKKREVLEGRATVGMTKEQVLAALGKPNEIIKVKNDQGVLQALWIYSDRFVDFEGDKLVSVKEKSED